VLVGAEGPNQLDGGPGADRLHGGGGDDHLDGGPGADILAGGGGDDDLAPAASLLRGSGEDRDRDHVACDEGADTAHDADLLDVVDPDCEEVWVLYGPVRPVRLAPPLQTPRAAVMMVTEDCPCQLRLALRTARSGRLLARRTIRGPRTVTIRLNRHGRKALRRARELLVRVELTENGQRRGFITVIRRAR